MSTSAQMWTEFGPAPITNGDYTGRVSAIVCSPTNANRMFVAGADGGVWRSTNGGATWTPLTDSMPSSAIGALAIDPTNESIIYAGTGEANFANHSRYGLGLYKSIDGGDTWTHLAEETFAGRCFSKIVINPLNPLVLYASITRAGGFPEMAAAKGHPNGAGPVGVFKSVDGGQTWTHLAGGLPALGATDLAIDTQNPSVVYAAIGHIFGSAQNGVYKSVNAGSSWTKLAGGLPTGSVGRISIACAPSNPQRLYALITNPATANGGNAFSLGAWRSDNGGQTWTALPNLGDMQATYGWYLSAISVQPTNADVAFFAGFSLRRTSNAGSSFSTVTPPHVDLHALAWDASGRLLAGDDGGVHRSTNLGSTWGALNDGLGIIQFYAGLSSHPTDPDILFGGTQDNGSNRRADATREWTQVFGGDGGWTQLDQQSPNRVFVEYQGTGNLFRSTDGGNSFNGAAGGINTNDRNCFLPPYLIDPTNSNRMFYATHRVYRSTNGGSSWTAISGDLTDGQGAIRALAIAPADPNVIYAATNDGNVQASFDGGVSFDLIANDAHGWPRTTRELFVSPTEPLTMYLAGARFGVDQVRRTLDGGQTWETLDGDLPNVPVNVVVEVFRITRQLFAGTDSGVYFSPNGGATWTRFGEGMPNACVIDLLVDEAHGRLLASTQGRGVWSVPLYPAGTELTDFTIVTGSHLGGMLADLAASDDAAMRFRSGFGNALTNLHHLEVIFGATTGQSDPQTIDLAIETRISHPSGSGRLRLRNWSTGAFEDVGQYPITQTDATHAFTDIPAAEYVREADGRIELSIRHAVFVPFFAFTFDTNVDLLNVIVN